MLRIIICIYFSLVSATSYAWWGKEHEIVALIAQKNLSKQALQKIDILLEGKTLPEIANWADSVKSQSKWSHSKRWHYVNIDKNESIDEYQVAVGGDILWALDYFYWQIGETTRSVQQRREALMFFVHLVADIHQPLHVGVLGDAGGNKKAVIWKNQNRIVNLHKVWDGLLTSPAINSYEYAEKMNNSEIKNRQLWLKSSFKDWAEESIKLHSIVYKFDDQEQQKKSLYLGSSYQNKNWPIAEKRILQAGVRLAHFLNQVFE
jgi:hypothetical protein